MRESLPTLEILAAKPDELLDIVRIALVIAAAMDEYPDLDPSVYLAQFDAMAEAIADAANMAMPIAERVAMLDRQLFDVEGFSGNRTDYYDPRNCMLNEVLERRTGSPIMLSVIYLEVGRRLGLPLVPVSFPAHFIVATTGARRVFIDPFNRGARIESPELLRRLTTMLGNAEHAREFLPQATVGATRREVVMRILRNLKGSYTKRHDLDRLLVIANQMVVVNPNSAAVVRDRGHVYAELECHRAAYCDYLQYLRLVPLANDAEDIRARAERLRPVATRLH